MNQLLSAAVTQGEHFVGNTLGERTTYALSHTAVGMLIVFGVLGVIWAILAVFKIVFGGKTEKKESAPAPAKKAAPAPAAAPAPVAATASSDEEIVAAITAAITLMREAEGSTGTFRVVSFRRTGGARPWNQA
ncbi:MAG: OadG family protein [Clostridia bacterium]|nr:OadG family protein [Clostridia bacterium]